MKNKARTLTLNLIGIGSALSLTLHATTLTFDDLTVSTYQSLPPNYGGFTWASSGLVGGQFGAGWGVDNTLVDFGGTYHNYASPSQPNAAFNWGYAGDLWIEISRDHEFNFDGAYFSGWGQNRMPAYWTAAALGIYGYNGNTLVHSLLFQLPTDHFQWVAANFSGVDKLVFATAGWAGGGSPWLMDDFTFSEQTSTTVPDSSQFLPAFAGLFLIGCRWFFWRRLQPIKLLTGPFRMDPRKVLVLVLFLRTSFASHSQPAQPATTNRVEPPKGRYVTANGVKLHYLDWRGSGDPVLLLTGLGHNAHVFDGFAPKLTNQCQVIALTRRGFGKSDKPTTGYDTATLVEDVRQFLNALEIPKVTLIGHSIAGDELTLFASLHPQRVHKLVYLDAAYDRTKADELFLSCPEMSPGWKRLVLEARGDPHASEIVVTNMPPAEDWEVLKAILKAADSSPPDYTKVQAQALAIYAIPNRYLDAYPETDEKLREKMETWWKEKAMPIARTDMARFRQQAKRGNIIELKNARHDLFLGKTQDEVVHRVREFIKSN